MNKTTPTPTSLITVLHDTKEWNTRIDGEIGEVRVDGKRLNDIHDLAVKVEGIAQSIKTLILCMGVILMISLICNIAMATWVYFHDEEITESIKLIWQQYGDNPVVFSK